MSAIGQRGAEQDDPGHRGNGECGLAGRAGLDWTGSDVRASSVIPKGAPAFGDGADLAQGDFGDAHSLRAALDGVEDVFLSGAETRGGSIWRRNHRRGCEAGVRRIVKLS